MAARILGVLLIVAGCAAPLGFVEGSTSHTMSAGGPDRSYRLYIPAGSRHRPHRWSS